MTNEKNKYLTLFESLSFPAFLIDKAGVIDNLNQPATKLIGSRYEPGGLYYGTEEDTNDIRSRRLTDFFPWLGDSLKDFLGSRDRTRDFEIALRESELYSYKKVHFARMRDVSGKFEGVLSPLRILPIESELNCSLLRPRSLKA